MSQQQETIKQRETNRKGNSLETERISRHCTKVWEKKKLYKTLRMFGANRKVHRDGNESAKHFAGRNLQFTLSDFQPVWLSRQTWSIHPSQFLEVRRGTCLDSSQCLQCSIVLESCQYLEPWLMIDTLLLTCSIVHVWCFKLYLSGVGSLNNCSIFVSNNSLSLLFPPKIS